MEQGITETAVAEVVVIVIISASRRTDIPACYSEWFFERMNEGYVYVRNPMNTRQIGKISLSPSVVDGIVFWTKNPLPMIKRIDELKDRVYYFQFTLTSYGKDIEANLPSKDQVLVPVFRELSEKAGKERVVWRYDPVFLNDVYTMDHHKKQFRVLASKLGGYTEKCTVSFLDLYRNISKNIRPLGIRVPTKEEQFELMAEFAKAADEYGFDLDTCAEETDFSSLGVRHACCIDKTRLERIGHYHLNVKKDPGQRAACGCVSSIDIGTYGTCKLGCVYCYADHGRKAAEEGMPRRDPDGPLLFGEAGEGDVIKEREMRSLVQEQMSLFEP